MVGAAPDPTGPWPQRSSPVPLRHLQGLHGSIAQCLDSPSPTGSSPGMDFPSNASGASAVAIDNKIEQAMDLVKSHLMFAVREEVEVLKDKIAELMDRINKLELENSILKANATQETLEQLLLAPKPCDVAALQQNGVPAQQGGQQNGGATP